MDGNSRKAAIYVDWCTHGLSYSLLVCTFRSSSKCVGCTNTELRKGLCYLWWRFLTSATRPVFHKKQSCRPQLPAVGGEFITLTKMHLPRESCSIRLHCSTGCNPFTWKGQLPLHSSFSCLKLRSHTEKLIVLLPSHCGDAWNSTPRSPQRQNQPIHSPR